MRDTGIQDIGYRRPPPASPPAHQRLTTCIDNQPRAFARGAHPCFILRVPQKESALGKHFSKKHFSKKQRRQFRELELDTAEIISFRGSKFEEERILPPIRPLNPTQAASLAALRG